MKESLMPESVESSSSTNVEDADFERGKANHAIHQQKKEYVDAPPESARGVLTKIDHNHDDADMVIPNNEQGIDGRIQTECDIERGVFIGNESDNEHNSGDRLNHNNVKEHAKEQHTQRSNPPKTFPSSSQVINLSSQTSIGDGDATGSDRGQRKSSLEMRKMPVNVLLKPAYNETASVSSEDIAEEKNIIEEEETKERDVLRLVCLRHNYTLRKQMMLSFGSINLLTIAVVVLVCVGITISTGDNVKEESAETMELLVTISLGYRARYLAESLSEKLILSDTVKFIYEATRDRFDGHPNPSDDGVPFFDMASNTSVYPIVGKPMPLEWDVRPDVNAENYNEFLQSRWKFYENRPVDATNAGFIMQGACDPTETNPLADAFWPNCTDSNNNIQTGGAIAPSQLTELHYRKGSDLVPLFRALFEEREEIRDLGLYFLNNGSGASINYPHYAASTQTSYISTGCDWILSPNPLDPSRTIGTEEMVTKCHPEGESVSSRIYNPMERAWCSEQALHPDKIFVDAYEDAWAPGEWLLFLGKSVYDRSSKDFIGCIYVGIGLGEINEILSGARATPRAETTVIQYNEQGVVVASSKKFKQGENLVISEAGVGLTKETYQELFNLVDFESQWDPKKVQEAYENFSTSSDTYIVSAHPMPAIPKEYDPLYQPIFFVVASSHVNDLYETVDALTENVDDRVQNVNSFAWICGLVGLGVSTAIIFAMAHILTSPLTNMNNVANEIVESIGDSKKEDEIRKSGDVSLESRCSPKTELNDVVTEFNKMVANFSGTSEAKSEKSKDDEMVNDFPARRNFLSLYECRNDKLFKYNPVEEIGCFGKINEDFAEKCRIDRSIDFVHLGPNHISAGASQTNEKLPDKASSLNLKSEKCSPLFLWIVLLIATPLLFITILVSVGVMTTVNIEFTRSTEDTQADYLALHKQVLLSYARLRSEFVASLTEKSTSDLHHLSRYSNWLLFGSLNRSDSFTEITTGIESCKEFGEEFTQCDYFKENFVCDCAWQERGYEGQCKNYTDEASRYLQMPHWVSEVSSTTDGDRYSTMYPNGSFSPESTAWWDDAATVPGADKEFLASGYDTTYDRIRVMSAIPVWQSLFHYGLGEGKETTLTLAVAFEADGLFMAYSGCYSSKHVGLSNWRSTIENHASELRPELCPIGKYGYDPRCRGWYDTGRKLATLNDTLLHVTSPYQFAQEDLSIVYAQSATVSIIDPMTQEYVGQVLLDLLSQPLYQTLENQTALGNDGFPILIAVQGDGEETIIGPGVSQDQDSVNIVEGVLPYDVKCKTEHDCAVRLASFQGIVDSMKRGESKEISFHRKKEKGDLETLHIAYSPVKITGIQPVNSADYSRGVNRVNHQIYSLALVETEEEALLSFEEIQSTTKRQTKIAIAVLAIVIFAAAISIIYISHRLATSFTEPMNYLLGMVLYINKHGFGQDPPQVRTVKSSYEIVAFSRTLEALYRIVRSANIAFFVGELDFAYRAVGDALRLFRRLDNKKAIGIASNNIGNILLAIYREMKAKNVDTLYGLSRNDVVSQGVAHFHNAIQLGETAYDQFYEMQGWSPSCLDFMQHLANRYFNRGLFLLHVKDDHNNPSEIEQLGIRDLQIASDMDQEVVAYGEESGWGSSDRAEKRLNVNIVRIRGFNILYELGFKNDWGVELLIDESVDIIREECKNSTSKLFENMSLGGRLQELEIQLMRYNIIHGDLLTAAKIAVRLIIEDERVLIEAMKQAIDVLIEYVESDHADNDFRILMVPILLSYQRAVAAVENEKRLSAKSDLDSISVSITKAMSSRRKSTQSFSQSQTSKSRVVDSNVSKCHNGEESSRFVTMEDF